MTGLTLIRHGEVAESAQGTHYGQLDDQLSARGVQQSRTLVERLAARTFDAIWSSDLVRARELAELLAGERGLAVQVRAALRERSLGVFQGLTYAQGMAAYPELAVRLRQRPGVDPVPGGENLEALARRVLPVAEEIVRKHPEQQIAVVCHGGPIRVLVGHVLVAPLQNVRRITLDHCSITEIEFRGDGDSRLRSVNARVGPSC